MQRDLFASLFGAPRPASPAKNLPPQQRVAKPPPPPPEVPDDQPLNPYSEIQLLDFHQDIVHTLIAIDDTKVASVSDDVSVAIWDVSSGKLVRVLVAPEREHIADEKGVARNIKSVIVMRHENTKESQVFHGRIVAAISDRTICVWDSATGYLPKVITTPRLIQCLVVLEDDMFCGTGKELHIWNSNGQLLKSSTQDDAHDEAQHILRISNGRLILACENNIVSYHYNVTTPEAIVISRQHIMKNHHRETITCLINVSLLLFASSSSDGAIIIWNQMLMEQKFRLNFFEVFIDPSTHRNQFIVTCMQMVDHFLVAAVGNGFAVYDTHEGSVVAEIKHAHFAPVRYISVINQGEIIATASDDASVRLWTLELFMHHESTPSSTPVSTPSSFSSSGNVAPTSSSSNIVTSPSQQRALPPKSGVFDFLPQTKKKTLLKPSCVGEMTVHRSSVNAIHTLSTGDFLTASSDGLVILWRNAQLASERRNLIAAEMTNLLRA